jgi:hypothetical protein
VTDFFGGIHNVELTDTHYPLNFNQSPFKAIQKKIPSKLGSKIIGPVFVSKNVYEMISRQFLAFLALFLTLSVAGFIFQNRYL